MTPHIQSLQARIAQRQTMHRSTAVLERKLIHAVADELGVDNDVGQTVFGLIQATQSLLILSEDSKARPYLERDLPDIELTISRLSEVARRLRPLSLEAAE